MLHHTLFLQENYVFIYQQYVSNLVQTNLLHVNQIDVTSHVQNDKLTCVLAM